jgi:hypothetical protein
MSALPPKAAAIAADQVRARSGLVHPSKSGSLFEHLVSGSEQRSRYLRAEHLGGRAIDD